MKIELNGKSVFFGTGSRSAEPKTERPAMLFVHGAGFDHSVWVLPARYFARHGHRVLAPDLPAHGRSEGPALASVEAMADWLAELLEQEQSGPVIAIGHSLGSLVVSSLAVRHAHTVARLALLGTSDPMAVGPPLLEAAADNHPAAFAMANTWSHSTVGRLGRAAMPGQSNFISGARWLARMPDGVYHADLRACNDFARAGRIEQPALVIAGTQDKMTPVRAGLSVAEQLVDAETVVLDCGHAMLSEKPNEVLDALAAFVNKADTE